MGSIRPYPRPDAVSRTPVEPLLLCPLCKIEMRLFGIEQVTAGRDLYTFECVACGGLEVRGVQGSQSVN